MLFPFKLKALDQKNAASATNHPNEKVDRQTIVPLVSGNSRSLSTLESIYRSLANASNSDGELVLKVLRNSGKRGQAAQSRCFYLRELAETQGKAHRFTSVLTTLRLVTQNVRRNSTTTLRDIYYRDVSAFQGSQRRSNEALKLISGSLGYSMERDLQINPSPKGLIYGGPDIHLSSGNGTTIDLTYGEYTLVPSLSCEGLFSRTEAIDAIVVMEKEAVFKSFCENLSAASGSARIIALTGKGNPDRASTAFLTSLRNSFPEVPISVFVDSDVYGLRILWTYILAAGGPISNVEFAGTFLLEHHRHGFLTIARREWKLMMNFLNEIESFQNSRGVGRERTLEVIKRELQRGMLLGKKAELNIICDSSHEDGLNAYLWRKVANTIGDKT